jgi:hypothetical protein
VKAYEHMSALDDELENQWNEKVLAGLKGKTLP